MVKWCTCEPMQLVSTPLSFTSLSLCMCISFFNVQTQISHSVSIHMQTCTVHRVRRAHLLQKTILKQERWWWVLPLLANWARAHDMRCTMGNLAALKHHMLLGLLVDVPRLADTILLVSTESSMDWLVELRAGYSVHVDVWIGSAKMRLAREERRQWDRWKSETT
jgi:hypothetical protein